MKVTPINKMLEIDLGDGEVVYVNLVNVNNIQVLFIPAYPAYMGLLGKPVPARADTVAIEIVAIGEEITSLISTASLEDVKAGIKKQLDEMMYLVEDAPIDISDGDDTEAFGGGGRLKCR